MVQNPPDGENLQNKLNSGHTTKVLNIKLLQFNEMSKNQMFLEFSHSVNNYKLFPFLHIFYAFLCFFPRVLAIAFPPFLQLVL